jgi:hypothetical protein
MVEVAEEFDAVLAMQREERARLRRLNERVLDGATKLANCIGNGAADPKLCANFVRDLRDSAEKLAHHLEEPGDDHDDEEHARPIPGPGAPTSVPATAPLSA